MRKNSGTLANTFATSSAVKKQSYVEREDSFDIEADVAARVHNFSAGPAALPLPVLLKAQREFLNYKGTGCSFIELSHRDVNGPVQNLMEETQELMKDLLDIPDNYHVLFMPGGAHLQFSAVPLNLCASKESTVGLVDTGFWSQRAASHAQRYVQVETISTNRGKLESFDSWSLPQDVSYVHMCMNETIAGLEYLTDPEFSDENKNDRIQNGDLNIVCDATSTLMSRNVDVSKYGVIFASAGKNLGTAGLTTIIVRDNLVQEKGGLKEICPEMLDWNLQSSSVPIQNVYNTPPTINVYLQNLVMKYYSDMGGMDYFEAKAKFLSDKVYNFLDDSSLFRVDVDEKYKNFRSRMNVCFGVNANTDLKKEIEADIIRKAESEGIVQLLGHPLFGGLRVTLYNAIEERSVNALLSFLHRYQRETLDESRKY
eukprot:augustus_masked-scaffold_2-processed-gene-4.55-mRNA-1 protein AED:0.34 eAED:0.34 QI:0/-1/0/1/-1/1/1/0/426